MEFTNKQIKSILKIQEFIEMANVLSRIYKDYDNKKLSIINVSEKNIIYKTYCSSMYNLIDAIKQSKYLFSNCRKYSDFELFINREYIANGNKYYLKSNYKADLYKIMKSIRDQANHFTRDDEDENMLFDIYIDFNIIEELRLIIVEIFYEVYNLLDKKKIENIILSKPKIQYSFDKINNMIDLAEKKCNESANELDIIFSKENSEAFQLLRDFFNPNDMFNFFISDERTKEKYDKMYNKMEELFNNVFQYIMQNGNDKEKTVMTLFKEFVTGDFISKNDYDKKLEKLYKELNNLNNNQNNE